MFRVEWNEPSTLELVAAVQGVDSNWGREWEPGEEMWQHVASELPHLPSYLGFDVEEIPEICKARFAFVAQCFNDLFTRYRRHPCLTRKVMRALADYSLTLDTHDQFPSDCTYPLQPIPSPYASYEEPAHARSPSPMTSEYTVASPRKSAAAEDERRGEGIPNAYDCDEKLHHRGRVSAAAAADERRGKGIPNTYGYDEEPHHRDHVSAAANEPGNERRRRHEPGSYEEVEEKVMKKEPNDDELLNEGRARVPVHGRTRDLEKWPSPGSSNFEEREIHPKREVDPYSFTIKLTESHTTGGLLYISAHKLHTPKKPVDLTCIWKGKEHIIKYLPNKRSLSAGWRKFARENGFRKDDVLVFCRLDSLAYEVFIEGD